MELWALRPQQYNVDFHNYFFIPKGKGYCKTVTLLRVGL